MKKIDVSTPTYPNLFALVDDEDFDWLNEYVWTAIKRRNTYYAKREKQKGGKRKCIYMHREVLKTPLGKFTDHRDGDGLNNQNWNLRECTTTQNLQNARKRESAKTSKYFGVSYIKGLTCKKKFRAQIRINKKTINLGNFLTEIEAARARDEAVKKYAGEFGRLNFPEEK